MNDDTISPVFIKPWITPKKIYGRTATQTVIDETWDEQLNPRSAKVWVQDIVKKKALDELFGEN